jgi:hypothetical protein
MRVSDNIMRISDHVFVVLPFERVVAEEQQLAFDYRYPFTAMNKELSLAWNVGHRQRPGSHVQTEVA